MSDEVVAHVRIVPETPVEHALALMVEELRAALHEACDLGEEMFEELEEKGIRTATSVRALASIAELRKRLPP